MEVFEFIIILVIITTLGKVLISVGVPMVNRLADLVRELSAGTQAGEEVVRAGLEPELLEEIETRMARIEDRLEFLEELKAPDRRRAIGGRGPGREPGGARAAAGGPEASKAGNARGA